MYFSDVDTAGHIHGPSARETLAAAEGLDSHIGHLVAGLERLGLLPQTTLIVVSDHGMSLQAPDRKVFIDDYIDLKFVDVIDWSPVLQLRPKATATVDEVYRALRGKHPSLAVYRREDVPRELHYSSHPRIAPVVAIASEGWQITTRQRFNDQPGRRAGGDHGYDPRVMQMHGLFVAAGPTLRQGLVVPRFENVHIYELMCRVLGLRPAKNDGDPAVTAGWMRSSAAQTFALRSRQSVRQSIPGS
jgi:predicted AlkP superfamily pyrophosphatase or phosphodiesterase